MPQILICQCNNNNIIVIKNLLLYNMIIIISEGKTILKKIPCNNIGCDIVEVAVPETRLATPNLRKS